MHPTEHKRLANEARQSLDGGSFVAAEIIYTIFFFKLPTSSRLRGMNRFDQLFR
jgi:hypothetical protein